MLLIPDVLRESYQTSPACPSEKISIYDEDEYRALVD